MPLTPIHPNDLRSLSTRVKFDESFFYYDVQAAQELERLHTQWPLLGELYARARAEKRVNAPLASGAFSLDLHTPTR